jgi:hypothetical protein
VTETELGDSGATYGVEVLLQYGRQVEVNLDQNYNVTSRKPTTTAPRTTTAPTTTDKEG